MNRIACFSALFFATGAIAGPLVPPAGPVAPTHKTLNEVEARIPISAATTPGDANSFFRITTRGSYYLTENLIGAPGFNGIEIAASGVTIDLNGFEVVGFAGSLDGIVTTFAGLADLTVMNGAVSNWGGEGVDFGTLAAEKAVLKNIHASANDNDGLRVGTGAVVERCVAFDNGADGIRAAESASITACVALTNANSGIQAGSGSVVRSCVSRGNGFHGIFTGGGITIAECSLTNNTGSGFSGGESCVVIGVVASGNADEGIETGGGASVTRCTTFDNLGSGISVGSDSTVSLCAARENTLDGIRVANDCLVLNNMMSGNGSGAGNGAGVHATGSRNRIEGNNCVTADRGVDVDGTDNLIIRNSCSGNTINWSIAAGNVSGLISDRTAPASAAVLGNSATSSLSFGDGVPNGNFTY